MKMEYEALLEKANTLKEEITKLENHIEAGKQFQGEDMYEALMGMTEELLYEKQQELADIKKQLKNLKSNHNI